MRLCGYARTSTLTNPYPRDQPPCLRTFRLTTPTPHRVLKRYRAASSAAANTAHTYGAAARAFSQRATSCGVAAKVWVSPYPAALSATCSRRSGLRTRRYKPGPTSGVRVAHSAGSSGRRAQASSSQEFQGHPKEPSCTNFRERGL